MCKKQTNKQPLPYIQTQQNIFNYTNMKEYFKLHLLSLLRSFQEKFLHSSVRFSDHEAQGQ